MNRHAGIGGCRMRALTTVLWLFALLLAVGSAHASGRVALVIGNGAYKNLPKLENPQGDAQAMAALLKSVGFDVVAGIDLTRDQMTMRLQDFGKKATGAEIALFYSAGQGIAVGGASFVLPVDADIKTEI